jgi:hypothetical protein
MWDCPHCGEILQRQDQPEKSRCPHCKEPIFERAGGPKLRSETGEASRGVCVVHTDNVASGTCKRCGALLCPVCRTKWMDEVLCAGCVERSMGADAINPQDRRSHNWQARLGLIRGIVGWSLREMAAIPLLLVTGDRNDQGLLTFSILMTVLSLLPSLLGAGQAAASVRTRGSRMQMATIGLVLCCSHLGLVLGVILIRAGRV